MAIGRQNQTHSMDYGRCVATPHHSQRGQWCIRSQKIANLNVNLNANSGHVQRSGFGFYIQYNMKMPKNVSSAVARILWRIVDADPHTGYIRITANQLICTECTLHNVKRVNKVNTENGSGFGFDSFFFVLSTRCQPSSCWCAIWCVGNAFQ